MKIITLQEPGRLMLSDGPECTAPDRGQALVRVHCVGICGTDYHAFAGKQPFFTYPRVLGHELGVEVLQVGEAVTNVKPGDRCSVEPYINCQTCIACRRGKPNCCTKMRVLGVHLDGGMRERFVLPASKLHVANQLAYEQIALVETLAIGAHAVARAQVERSENVVVIGAGPIGLSVIQFAKLESRVIVLDVNEQRLAFCRDHLGINDVVDARADALAAVSDLTHGDMATVVLDATGNPRSMAAALQFVAHGGRLVYIGLFQGDFVLNDPEFHRRETTLLASRNALPGDFARIIEGMHAGKIDTRPWITHQAPATEAPTAIPAWTVPTSGCVKGVIHFA